MIKDKQLVIDILTQIGGYQSERNDITSIRVANIF